MSAASASVLPPAPAQRSSTIMPALPRRPQQSSGSRHPALRHAVSLERSPSLRPDDNPIPRVPFVIGRASGQLTQQLPHCVVFSALARTCSGARSSRPSRSSCIQPASPSTGSIRSGSSEGRAAGSSASIGRQAHGATRRTGRQARHHSRASPTIAARPVGRRLAEAADRAIDQLAHRAAGPSIPHSAARRNSGRSACQPQRPSARAAAITWSSSSMAAWTQAEGVIAF